MDLRPKKGKLVQAPEDAVNQTGLTPEVISQRAVTIIEQILKHPEYTPITDRLTPEDKTFLRDMIGKWQMYGQRLIVTGRQLFWLRDCRDKLDEPQGTRRPPEGRDEL